MAGPNNASVKSGLTKAGMRVSASSVERIRNEVRRTGMSMAAAISRSAPKPKAAQAPRAAPKKIAAPKASAKTSSSPAAHEDSVMKTIHAATAKHRDGTLLSMKELRGMTKLSKPDFDAAALRLSSKEKIALHHHDHPHSLTKHERDTMVLHPNGTHFIGLALRRSH